MSRASISYSILTEIIFYFVVGGESKGKSLKIRRAHAGVLTFLFYLLSSLSSSLTSMTSSNRTNEKK